jgi:hypothetical protein
MAVTATSAPSSEIAVRDRPATRKGFFTDTTTCIGCKACEVACKQWNDLPSDGGELRAGGSYDHTQSLGASTWRHVRFVEVLAPQPDPIPGGSEELDLLAIASGGATLERWVFMSDVCKQEERTTFRELLDLARKRQIEMYMHEGTLSRSEVAHLLGFSDERSLVRASNRWRAN